MVLRLDRPSAMIPPGGDPPAKATYGDVACLDPALGGVGAPAIINTTDPNFPWSYSMKYIVPNDIGSYLGL